MLKTNSKIVKERLAKYIVDNADVGDGKRPETIDDACEYIAKDFTRRFGYMWEYPRHCNVQDAFYNEYALSLCNDLFDFIAPSGAIKGAWDVLKEMLDETDEEASRFSPEQADRLLCDLIYLKFIRDRMWGGNDL